MQFLGSITACRWEGVRQHLWLNFWSIWSPSIESTHGHLEGDFSPSSRRSACEFPLAYILRSSGVQHGRASSGFTIKQTQRPCKLLKLWLWTWRPFICHFGWRNFQWKWVFSVLSPSIGPINAVLRQDSSANINPGMDQHTAFSAIL